MSSPYPQVGNNNVAGQHRCPNPLCNISFLSTDDVCAHLSVPGTPCTIWTQDLVHNLFGRDTVQHLEDDFNDGEKYVLLQSLQQMNICSDELASIDSPCNDIGITNTGDDDDEIPTITLPTGTDAPPSISLMGLQKQYHPNHSAYGSGFGGQNMLQKMDDNSNADIWRTTGNLYYPFTSKDEWQLAYWFTCSSLPQTQVEAFLCLNWVCSFCVKVSLHLCNDII